MGVGVWGEGAKVIMQGIQNLAVVQTFGLLRLIGPGGKFPRPLGPPKSAKIRRGGNFGGFRPLSSNL